MSLRTIEHRQRGFAAVAAIFLVVILAALGGFMVSFSNTQQLTSAQDIQGTRAYWAARAGLEWAVGAIVASAPVPPATTPAATCPVSAPPASIDGFGLTITCNRQLYTEGTKSVYIFRIISVASIGTAGSIGRIERSVSASLEQ
jgi:MSHA biogenesis protein MshP